MRDESQKEILLTESSNPENQGHDDDTHTITYYPTAVDLVQGQEGVSATLCPKYNTMAWSYQ